MTRPLKYDDSFINILTHKIHDKFLYCIPLKVQSTAFFRKYSLLQALLLIGIFDLIVGLVYMYLFAKIITITHDFFVIFEIVILMLSFIFGLLGIYTSSALVKSNSRIYKNWRITITLLFPMLELINDFFIFSYVFKGTHKMASMIIIATVTLLNLYFSKVAWSFYVRMDKSHELLIVYGKYLDKMMEGESYKMSCSVVEYNPPPISNMQPRDSIEKDDFQYPIKKMMDN